MKLYVWLVKSFRIMRARQIYLGQKCHMIFMCFSHEEMWQCFVVACGEIVNKSLPSFDKRNVMSWVRFRFGSRWEKMPLVNKFLCSNFFLYIKTRTECHNSIKHSSISVFLYFSNGQYYSLISNRRHTVSVDIRQVYQPDQDDIVDMV